MSDFYEVLPIVTVGGKTSSPVTSFEDYLTTTGQSSQYLTPEDIADARAAITGATGVPTGELPEWLTVPEGEEEAIEKSITKSNPYGGDTWVDSVVKRFGLEQTLRMVGRPKGTKNGG